MRPGRAAALACAVAVALYAAAAVEATPAAPAPSPNASQNASNSSSICFLNRFRAISPQQAEEQGFNLERQLQHTLSVGTVAFDVTLIVFGALMLVAGWKLFTVVLFAAGFPIIRKQLPTQLEGDLGAAAVEAGGDAMAQAAVAELQAGVDEGAPAAANVPEVPAEEEAVGSTEPLLLDVPPAPPVVPVLTTTMMSAGSKGPEATPSSNEPEPATLASPVETEPDSPNE